MMPVRRIALPQSDVLQKLNDEMGLHPQMTGIKEFFSAGNLAIVEGAGPTSPNRSHFRSIEIWQTAEPDKIGDTSWPGRYA